MDKKKMLITGYYVREYPRHQVLIDSLEEVFEIKERNYRDQGCFSFFKTIKKDIKGQDYVFILNSSYKFIFLVLYLKLFTNKKIIYDAFLSFYDTFVIDRKRFKKYSVFAIFAYLLDFLVCQSSKILIFDTKEHGDYFKKTFFLSKKKKYYIWPVSLDLEKIDKDIKIFPDGKFNIFFYGTYIPLQGIEYIVKAAKILKTNKEINFIIVGKGQEEKNIKNLARKYNLNNLSFYQPVSYRQLFKYIKQADVCLGIFGNSDKAKRVVANKVIECLALKKIVITGRTKAVERFFENRKEIIYCNLADEKDLAQKIVYVKDHFHELKGLGEQARIKVEKHFSKSSLVNKIKELYE
jgi:glycosyltransferase involved in cell wall biosynthesis